MAGLGAGLEILERDVGEGPVFSPTGIGAVEQLGVFEMKIYAVSSLWIVALIFFGGPLAGEDFVPTPYTAEQIRDAWVEGFEVTTRSRSAVGEIFTLTRVIAWSEVGFGMVEIELDAQGRPMERDPDVISGTWVELRDHARFPAASASRARAVWDTPLGRLAGWLYRVEDEEDATEFFFADDHPGPPVVSRRLGEGLDGFVAEQVAREIRLQTESPEPSGR